MKKTILLVLLCTAVLYGCKHDKKSLITGKWHAVTLENPEMDSFFANSQAYIDTVGKGHDAATNIALYGIANMDSMRQLLQMQYDSAKNMQLDAVKNTIFEFRKDSVAVLVFNGQTDSTKWYFDADGVLVMEDLVGGTGDKVTMHVLELTERQMKLKFEENNSASTVTFHPEGK